MFVLADDTPAVGEYDVKADISRIGDTLTSEIPEPQQHAIDQATEDAARENPQAVELDALGVPWNPAQHATGKDGKGVRTQKGAWRKRKGLKGSDSFANTSAAGATKTEPEDPAAVERKHVETQSRMAGAMMAQVLTQVSAGIGGPAFYPRDVQLPGGGKYNEQEMLSQAFGDYCVAKGVVDVPPGVALCGALMLYYTPRLRVPEVRERGSRIYEWTKEKIARVAHWWKYRKGGAPKDSKRKPNGAAEKIREDGVFDTVRKVQDEPSHREL